MHSQCQAEILDWTATSDTTFSIVFNSSSEGTFFLKLQLDYYYSDEEEIFSIEGVCNEGLNSITAVVDSVLEDGFYAFLDAPATMMYFTTFLSIECENEQLSDTAKFYMSYHSMLSQTGISCQNFLMPFVPLPDEATVFYEFETGDDVLSGDLIESLSVFLDMGHTHNADLIINLIHPNGTEITLVDEEQDLTLLSSDGFSVIFSSAGDSLVNLEPESLVSPYETHYGPRGIFRPYDSLDSLIGLPAEGTWTISFEDGWGGDNGMLFGLCLSINGMPCTASLQGFTFLDQNENGELDFSEPKIPYVIIENSISQSQFVSNSNGNFLNCTEEGEGFLNAVNLPSYLESGQTNFTASLGDILNGIKIPVFSALSLPDLSVDLVSLEPNRPGFEAEYSAQISNLGTACHEDFFLQIVFPEYTEIIGSTDPDINISENIASIEIEELCSFSSLNFSLTIELDDTVALGTILESTISTVLPSDDPTPQNNSFTSSTIVVGSYDPNDKQVSHQTIGDEFLEEGSPLKYTIRFQNTGTFYAERVVIADTIDADLDINSLNIISTSHNMELSREGNVLYFEFDQIFLPDSATDFDGSIGHVRYEMNPLTSFSEGDIIENTAYIYFDFNEPIVTNTVVTGFGNPLGVSNESGFETRLFPNPADQRINLSWPQEVKVNRIEIFDLAGRLIESQSVLTDQFLSFDISQFTEGMYVVNLISTEMQSRQKFMKIAER